MEKDFVEMETIVKEETFLFDKPIVSPKNYDWVSGEVLALIFHTPKDNLNLCGKSMLNWVKLACVMMPTTVLDEPSDKDFLPTIKELCGGKKIVLVLYSDTPLLEQTTILEALDYFSSKNLNALVLPRGFIFKTEFIDRTSELFSPIRKNFAPEQFKQINNSIDISNACEVLWQKIRDFHKSNGVCLFGEQTIFIDADVKIDSGVIIEPMNIIQGQSVIEENVTLQSGNFICDSVIKAGATLRAKTIINGEEK